MRTSSIVGFCGNSWRPAKSRVLVAVASELLLQQGLKTDVLDLVDAGCGIAAFSRTRLGGSARAVVEAVEPAEGLVIGCRVFQHSYSGLFKHVFDLIEPGVLRNRPVLLTAVGCGLRHSLVVEHLSFGRCSASSDPAPSRLRFMPAVASVRLVGHLGPIIPARLTNAVQQFATLLSPREAHAA